MGRVRRVVALLAVSLVLAAVPATALADGAASDQGDSQYQIGTTVNAGSDCGYSGSDPIAGGDIHAGWELGSFSVSGYSSVETSADGSPVFLLSDTDHAVLSFTLEQDIDCLNGDETLTVCDDTDGYDDAFGVAQADLGRGTLIISQKSSGGTGEDPQVITDFLPSFTVGELTEVAELPVGDYVVALDYELKHNTFKVPLANLQVTYEYPGYATRFSFSVRKADEPLVLRDIATGGEVSSGSSVEDGFVLELTDSNFLTVTVKREVLTVDDELVEDPHANEDVANGQEFTAGGVYTVTVKDRATGQETQKTVYVGTNELLKAYAATGMPIDEIKANLEGGSTVAADGTLVEPDPSRTWIAVVAGAVVLAAALAVIVLIMRRWKAKKEAAAPKAGCSQSTAKRASGGTAKCAPKSSAKDDTE